MVLFSPLLLSGAAWSTRGGVALFFSFAWCCLCSPPFGGAAFSPGWCCWVFLLLLGAVAVQDQKEKMQSKEKFENSGKVQKCKMKNGRMKNEENEENEEDEENEENEKN